MTCKTMKQNENDQNHKKESTPVVDDKPNGKSQFISMIGIGPSVIWSPTLGIG